VNGFVRAVIGLMRRVRRNVERISRTDRHFVAAKNYVKLTFQNDKGLLEVVAMWRRSATGQNDAVDQTKAAIGIVPGEQDGIGVPDKTDMRKAPIFVGLSESENSLKIVGWDFETRSSADS